MTPPKPIDLPEFIWVWNQTQTLDTPALHVRIARWLARRWRANDRELLLMAFRDSGKSTLVGLFCAWLLYLDPATRIMILAADHALARKMVRNVKRLIERHPLTRHLKPDRRDQWAADQFTVNRAAELRDPSMLAKGIGANITGSRADVVICDDVEVPNTCDTPPKRADLRARLREIDYVLVPSGLQLYVGTPHSYYTLYADRPRAEAGETQPFLDGFARLVLPIIDGKDRSRWPERFPPSKIEALRRRSGPAKFDSQMLLAPRNMAEGRLDPDRLRPYDDELSYVEGNGFAALNLGARRLVSASCWWDPAYGAPAKGDASVIAVVFTDEAGMARLHRIRYLTHDPSLLGETDEATQLCRQVAAFVGEFRLPSLTLETNGLGRFLPGLLRRELAETGIGCAVLERASRQNKQARILDAFDARLANGNLLAHRSVWETPFVQEMRDWQPIGKSRDDGLDAVAGCLLAEPMRLPRRSSPVAPDDGEPARPDWRPGGGAFTAQTDFDV